MKPSAHKKKHTTKCSGFFFTPFLVFLPFTAKLKTSGWLLGWFEVLISSLPPCLKGCGNRKSFPLGLRLFKTTPARSWRMPWEDPCAPEGLWARRRQGERFPSPLCWFFSPFQGDAAAQRTQSRCCTILPRRTKLE